MSKQLIMVFLSVIFLSGCSTMTDVSGVRNTQTEALQESVISSENDGDIIMKHEILRMSHIEGQELILINTKKEEYVIPKYSKYNIEFCEGHRIGITYTSKEIGDDGRYILDLISLTEESNGFFLENGL